MKWLYILLLVCVGSLQAEQDSRKELSQLQEEIDQLQREMHRIRLKAIGEELKGNEYMRTQWGEYVEQIEKSETYDVDILKMEKQLEQLQKKQRELLIQYKLKEGSPHEP